LAFPTCKERIERTSKKSPAELETLRRFEAMATTDGFRPVHPAPPLDQRHLWRQVVSLQHLNGLVAAAETHVFDATVGTATYQPEGVVHQNATFSSTIVSKSSRGREE